MRGGGALQITYADRPGKAAKFAHKPANAVLLVVSALAELVVAWLGAAPRTVNALSSAGDPHIGRAGYVF
ncbi:hypothetical protein Psi02_54210 [Planotetraspora silvatica]|uniref:Uncharacterized protein n=1 Tax=Planotetraspora silvatica TaxID=234614 RepID=A0A8J3XNV7_9ACTN|nr:hypothetical protein [Planotetraspora silvatica]GII48997.1 hypothetical protein Psi02_54210 [Planotetraspora silvatica]